MPGVLDIGSVGPNARRMRSPGGRYGTRLHTQLNYSGSPFFTNAPILPDDYVEPPPGPAVPARPQGSAPGAPLPPWRQQPPPMQRPQASMPSIPPQLAAQLQAMLQGRQGMFDMGTPQGTGGKPAPSYGGGGNPIMNFLGMMGNLGNRPSYQKRGDLPYSVGSAIRG